MRRELFSLDEGGIFGKLQSKQLRRVAAVPDGIRVENMNIQHSTFNIQRPSGEEIAGGPPALRLKPRKISVPMAEGRCWRGGGEFIYQEKMDGEFSIAECGVRSAECATLAGERMATGRFVAFDVLQHAGQDVRAWPLRDRWGLLLGLRGVIEADGGEIVPTGNGGEFLEAVLAAGGEGVVAKDWNSPYSAPMFACKRLETFLCVVTGFCGGTQSVAMARMVEGSWLRVEGENAGLSTLNSQLSTTVPCGHVALRGGKCDQVRVGSIIKVEGMGLTAAGMIREPRVCRDTATSWLVKF